jgi:peptidoglycan/LPS O-acetylase OafA/YrhL
MNGAPRPDREELSLYLVIAGVGLIPIVIVLIGDHVFDGAATIGLLMVACAFAGLIATWSVARTRRNRIVRIASSPRGDRAKRNPGGASGHLPQR